MSMKDEALDEAIDENQELQNKSDGAERLAASLADQLKRTDGTYYILYKDPSLL